jgi:Skp family chaperone for outer membrane proteins
MEQQEAYEKDINIKLKKWEAKIDELKADMDKVGAQKRESYYKELERLRKLQHKAQEKLESMKHAGKESFKDIKSGVNNAVKDLGEAVGSAFSRFK